MKRFELSAFFAFFHLFQNVSTSSTMYTLRIFKKMIICFTTELLRIKRGKSLIELQMLLKQNRRLRENLPVYMASVRLQGKVSSLQFGGLQLC